MPQYDAVLFDVDGTLVDSAPGIIHTLEQTFRRMGVTVSGQDLKKYVGPPLRRTFGEYFSAPEQIEQATSIYRESYEGCGALECTLYPGVKEMLQVLADKGVRLYTATSKPTGVVTPILQRLGIASYFTFIGGASYDRSRDTKAAVIREVLARPELQGAKILMVGDRKEDMEGAAECSLPAAAVLYGYGSPKELEPFSPVCLVSDCRELVNYILNER